MLLKKHFPLNIYFNVFGFVAFKMGSKLEAKLKGGLGDCDRK